MGKIDYKIDEDQVKTNVLKAIHTLEKEGAKVIAVSPKTLLIAVEVC